MTPKKVTGMMVSTVGASGRMPMFGRAPLAPTMQGAQTRYRAARRAAPTFCNDEVAAQSCSEQDRWTFYETIFLKASQLAMRNLDLQTVQELAHLFVGDFILSGDFHSQGAGDFPVLGCFPNFHADFFFFHNTPSQNFRENIAQMPAGKNKKVKQIP